jgi:hypothetical protein
MTTHIDFLAVGTAMLALGGGALTASVAWAQAVPTRFPHEFTKVAAACERSDGSVVVTDAGDNSIVLLASDGTSRAIGRRGAGPGEYQAPGACFHLGADTLIVLDRVLRRFVLLPPDVSPATLAFPPTLGTGWFEPLGVDERGRILLQGRTIENRAPALAWSRATNRVDTLLTFDVGKIRSTTAGSMSLTRDIPFEPRAAVAAGRALGVALVLPEPFRVDIWRAGSIQRGEIRPWTPVAVSDADVERYIESQAPPENTVGRSSDGRMVTMPRRRWTLENFGLKRDDFPARKPPFDHEGMFVSPVGALWIRLFRPAEERSERYEVRQPDGRFGPPVTLPANRHLVGLGDSDAYVVATSDDGIQYLERLKISR